MPVRSWLRIAAVAVLGSIASLAATPAKPDPAAGKAIYERECASCHGATGKGDGDDGAYFTTKPTDFTGPALSKRTDDFLAAVITGGGAAKGLSKDMPGAKLSPAEVRSVVAYIRTFPAGAK